MVGEVFAGVTAFNAMLNAAKALRDMDNAVSRNSAIIDLQGQILAAQEDYAKLRETVGKLENQLAGFETWESEKQRYVLKEHGERLALAYALKEGVEPPEHPHSICPDCYQQRKRSILQTVHHLVGHSNSLVCHVCGWEAYTRGHKHAEHSAKSTPRRR
jgi:hypothetical protein